MVDSIFGKADATIDSPLPTPAAFSKLQLNGHSNGLQATTNGKVVTPTKDAALIAADNKRNSATPSAKKEVQSS